MNFSECIWFEMREALQVEHLPVGQMETLCG